MVFKASTNVSVYSIIILLYFPLTYFLSFSFAFVTAFYRNLPRCSMSKSKLTGLKEYLKGYLHQIFCLTCHVCNWQQYPLKPQGHPLPYFHVLAHDSPWSSHSEVNHWIYNNFFEYCCDTYQVWFIMLFDSILHPTMLKTSSI